MSVPLTQDLSFIQKSYRLHIGWQELSKTYRSHIDWQGLSMSYRLHVGWQELSKSYLILWQILLIVQLTCDYIYWQLSYTHFLFSSLLSFEISFDFPRYSWDIRIFRISFESLSSCKSPVCLMILCGVWQSADAPQADIKRNITAGSGVLFNKLIGNIS